MEIIYCRGGDTHAATIARKTNMKYGSRYDYTAYASVYMLDGGEHPEWSAYIKRATEWQPTLALAGDFFGDTEAMLQQVDELNALGVEQVAVCPKFTGAVALIPKECVIAVSVRTSYAGFQPFPYEVVGRDLHLLGGHPDQQLKLKQIYEAVGAKVVSIDGNILGYKADHGQFWRKAGGWQTAPKGRFQSIHLAIQSGHNIREYFNRNAPVKTARRVERSLYFGELLV